MEENRGDCEVARGCFAAVVVAVEADFDVDTEVLDVESLVMGSEDVIEEDARFEPEGKLDVAGGPVKDGPPKKEMPKPFSGTSSSALSWNSGGTPSCVVEIMFKSYVSAGLKSNSYSSK